jgi:hypothetical protein
VERIARMEQVLQTQRVPKLQLMSYTLSNSRFLSPVAIALIDHRHNKKEALEELIISRFSKESIKVIQEKKM